MPTNHENNQGSSSDSLFGTMLPHEVLAKIISLTGEGANCSLVNKRWGDTYTHDPLWLEKISNLFAQVIQVSRQQRDGSPETIELLQQGFESLLDECNKQRQPINFRFFYTNLKRILTFLLYADIGERWTDLVNINSAIKSKEGIYPLSDGECEAYEAYLEQPDEPEIVKISLGAPMKNFYKFISDEIICKPMEFALSMCEHGLSYDSKLTLCFQKNKSLSLSELISSVDAEEKLQFVIAAIIGGDYKDFYFSNLGIADNLPITDIADLLYLCCLLGEDQFKQEFSSIVSNLEEEHQKLKIVDNFINLVNMENCYLGKTNFLNDDTVSVIEKHRSRVDVINFSLINTPAGNEDNLESFYQKSKIADIDIFEFDNELIQAYLISRLLQGRNLRTLEWIWSKYDNEVGLIILKKIMPILVRKTDPQTFEYFWSSILPQEVKKEYLPDVGSFYDFFMDLVFEDIERAMSGASDQDLSLKETKEIYISMLDLRYELFKEKIEVIWEDLRSLEEYQEDKLIMLAGNDFCDLICGHGFGIPKLVITILKLLWSDLSTEQRETLKDKCKNRYEYIMKGLEQAGEKIEYEHDYDKVFSELGLDEEPKQSSIGFIKS